MLFSWWLIAENLHLNEGAEVLIQNRPLVFPPTITKSVTESSIPFKIPNQSESCTKIISIAHFLCMTHSLVWNSVLTLGESSQWGITSFTADGSKYSSMCTFLYLKEDLEARNKTFPHVLFIFVVLIFISKQL